MITPTPPEDVNPTNQDNFSNINNPNLLSTLKQLQTLIKQEAMQKEIVLDIRDNLFGEMETNLNKILENKLKISEKIDKSNQDDSFTNYILNPVPNQIYKDETMYVSKIMIFLRKYQDYLYKILIDCKSDKEKRTMSNLVANYFYTNIFSANSIEEEYLFMLYRLLKKEIESLTHTNVPEKFLNNSICSHLLQYLICNDDIKVYFGKILNEIIDKIDNKEDNQEIVFEIDSRYNEKREAKEYKEQKEKKAKDEDSYEHMIKSALSIKVANEDGSGKTYLEMEKFFASYISDLTKKELQLLLNKMDNVQMKEYIIKQFAELNLLNNDTLFTNNLFFEKVYSSKDSAFTLTTYLQYFSITIEIITKIFENLNKNISIIPDSLRFICKIIAVLIQKRFPRIMRVELNSFVANFFFKLIMKPIFTETDFNGLLTSKLLANATKKNIITIGNIIEQLLSASFFKSTEFPCHTTFNFYFIEIMPEVIKFFNNFLDTELPPLIQKMFEIDKTQTSDDICKNYIYNYLEENPEEILQYTTVCFTPEQIITVFNIINRNEKQYFSAEIDECMKADYAYFKGSYNKLTDPDHMMFIEEVKNNDERAKTLTFIVIQQMILSSQLQSINKLKRGPFSFKEKETPQNDEERNNNLLIKVKNALSAILFNIHDIPKANFFGTTISNTMQFVETVLQLMKINYYTLDDPVQTEWYILSLNLLLPKLPDEYRINDYEKLYEEFINEVQQSINSIDITVFTNLKNKTRYIAKELKQTKSKLQDIETAAFNKKIQDFLENGKIEVNMNFSKHLKKKKLIIESNQSESILKFKYLDNFLFEKKERQNIIDTIHKFIRRFPNISKGKSEFEVFDLEKSLEIPAALVKYYELVKQSIKEYLLNQNRVGLPEEGQRRKERKKSDKELELERLKEEQIKKKIETDSQRIFKEIMNYIMSKIYDKLFPKEYDFKDVKIHQQCVMLSWIEPHHIGRIPKINLETFLPTTLNYIQQLDDIKNPYEKMAVFTKVSEIILNTLNFCVGKVEGGVDDTLPLLLFVIIKAQPKSFASNMKFIELYYNDLGHGPDSQRFAILTAIQERLLHFTHSDLVNVSEEEYRRNCDQQ